MSEPMTDERLAGLQNGMQTGDIAECVLEIIRLRAENAELQSQLAAERERSERRRRLLAHHQYEVTGRGWRLALPSV